MPLKYPGKRTPHTPNTSCCVTVFPLRAQRAAGSRTVCVPESMCILCAASRRRGYYGDSSPVHAFLALENAVLGSVEDGAPRLKLRLRAGERPAHDGSYSAQVDYVHYYGRTKPEPYTCGMQDASHDFAFTLRDAAQMDALRGLLGSAVVYKDCWGDVVIGGAWKYSGGPWPCAGCAVHCCRDRSQAGDQL